MSYIRRTYLRGTCNIYVISAACAQLERWTVHMSQEISGILTNLNRDPVNMNCINEINIYKVKTSKQKEKILRCRLHDRPRDLHFQPTIFLILDLLIDSCVCVSAACAQVERWLEELHDRRRCLEVLFSNRRTILDQCRTLCQLYAELGTARAVWEVPLPVLDVKKCLRSVLYFDAFILRFGFILMLIPE